MKFQLISDIHLEYLEGDEGLELNFDAIIEPAAPILVMAGDVATFDCRVLPLFISWVSTKFQYVFWVLGNHEFYNTKGLSMTEIKKQLIKMCPSNVHILDNSCITIDDVVFIGSTLWSHVPNKFATKVHNVISDYRYIYSDSGEGITVEETNAIYRESIAYIQEMLQKYKHKHKVVITHHSPSLMDTIHPIYHGSPLNHAFATDIVCEGDDGPDVWCYGHTHYNVSVDKHSHGYKLVSNQFGYEGEHDGRLYKYSYCVDIGSESYYG